MWDVLGGADRDPWLLERSRGKDGRVSLTLTEFMKQAQGKIPTLQGYFIYVCTPEAVTL